MMHLRSGLRRPTGSSEIAEFIPALYILFIVMFFPLLNLVNCFIAAAVQYLAVNDIASKASVQPDYSTALSSMFSEAGTFQNNGFTKFSKMTPSGGYVGCGNDMYVVVNNNASPAPTLSPANQPLTQPINITNNNYEFLVRSRYSIEPLISFASIPGFSSIPGLGKPVVVSIDASRPVEHPGGLQAAYANTGGGSTGGGAGGGVQMFPRVTYNLNAGTTPTWSNPNVYDQILAAGQTVQSVNVVQVQYISSGYKNENNWLNSGVPVANGQKIWIDTQAAGLWHRLAESSEDSNPNANIGAAGRPADPYTSDFQFVSMVSNPFSLIGYVCPDTKNPKLPWMCRATDQFSDTDPQILPVGSALLNSQPAAAGTLLFSSNSRICPGWMIDTARDVSFNGTDVGMLGGSGVQGGPITGLPYQPHSSILQVHDLIGRSAVVNKCGYQIVRVIATN